MNESATHQFEPDDLGFIKQRVVKLLDGAGLAINGSNPWDIQVKNPSFYKHALLNGSLGLGESYVNEWWECDQLDALMNRILRSDLAHNHKFLSHITSWIRSTLFNLQNCSRAFRVGEEHYDKGNDLYAAMLDSNMVYTCGYWARPKPLRMHKLTSWIWYAEK